MNEEVRMTDPNTGGQKGVKMERFDLIPTWPMEELARVYGWGATKYDDHNWRRGYRWGWSFGALLRHAWAFWRGVRKDHESGLHPLAHVAWHAFTLMTFDHDNLGTDDRVDAWKKVTLLQPKDGRKYITWSEYKRALEEPEYQL